MNTFTKYIIVVGAIFASIFALPLLFKVVGITSAVVLLALVFASIFILGVLATLVLLSPLWIPFLAGWAAVRFCKKYYKKTEPISPQI